MSESDYVIVLVTMPADGEALRFATTLIEDRLAACVNVQSEMQSVYRWQGQIEQGFERQIVIKTTADLVPRLRERVKSLHPYDVPEFLVVPVTGGSEDYLKWVKESVERSGG